MLCLHPEVAVAVVVLQLPDLPLLAKSSVERVILRALNGGFGAIPDFVDHLEGLCVVQVFVLVLFLDGVGLVAGQQ